jgi:hypothetical protein
MKKLVQMKRNTILSLLISLCLVASFIGGCSAKLLYETYNNLPWLNSVVVAIFEGLFFCSWSLMGFLASRTVYKQTKTLDSKVKAGLIFFFFGIPPMLIGLRIFQIAVRNFIELL